MGLLFNLRPKGVVPTGTLSVDWSHPLANGLIGCYVPGVSGGINIAGGQSKLSLGGSLVLGVRPEGPAAIQTASQSDASGSATPSFTSWNTFSLYWRGHLDNGTASDGSLLIGVTYDAAGNNPYYISGIGTLGVAITGAVGWKWNTGGTLGATSVVPSGLVAGTAASFGATFTVGGNTVGYVNGKNVKSTAFGSGAPASGSGPLVNVGAWHPNAVPSGQSCYVGYFWNRVLSDDEMAALDRDPYCFIVSAETEMPALYVAAGGITGTAALTEAADTLSGSSTLQITGTAAPTEGADTLSSASTLTISCTLSATEAADTLSGSSTLDISGTLSVAEAADTLSSASTLAISSNVSATEAADTLNAFGLQIVGSLSVSETPDGISSLSELSISGSLSVAERADTLIALDASVAGAYRRKAHSSITVGAH